MDSFDTEHIAFCFDSRTSKRQKMYPLYKEKRRIREQEATEEERKNKQVFYDQVQLLRREYLPNIGFKNIFVQGGYEADDIIASLVKNTILQSGDRAVIISSDSDLLQLLEPWCILWNPTKEKTISSLSFQKEWGISPVQWAEVKAWAGCSSDSVPGVPGVGEKTAAKYLRGELDPKLKKYKEITNNLGIYTHNIKLVRLPLEGVDTFQFAEDEVTPAKWKKVYDHLARAEKAAMG